MRIEIPPNLASGYVDEAWLDALPLVVDHARELWSLEIGDPYLPGGAASWVARVDRDGEKLVLKVGLRDPEAEHEIDGLEVWAGRGVVLLRDSLKTENTIVLLLERCEPGTTLGTLLPEPEQDVVIADCLQRLWVTPPAAHPFRPLSAMTELWTETLERDLAQRHYAVNERLVDETRRIYREEGDNCSAPRLLCTDLHAANVLAAKREPWLVIDPKPFVGDPAYDTAQHMLNCLDRLEDDPFGLADRMASLTDVDPRRARIWLFARALQESLGDEEWQRRLRPVAARLGHDRMTRGQ